jgi:hypothetical protein
VLTELVDQMRKSSFDELCRHVEIIETSDPVPITDAVAPRRPGVYLLSLRASRLACYRRAVTTGCVVYCGSADSLADRLSDHRRTFRQVRNIRMSDIAVWFAELADAPAAIEMEARLIAGYRPVWNEKFCSGLGSKRQGPNRSGQARTAFDALHPGRSTGSKPPKRPRQEIARLVEAHLASTATQVRRWRRMPASSRTART